MILTLALTVYGTVLIAELVGDKTLYTVGALSATHHGPAVVAGAGIAVALKMGAAVLLGRVLGHLPALLLSLLSVATFIGVAAGVWRSRSNHEPQLQAGRADWRRGARLAFLGLFLSEWADFGQVTAATLTAQHGRPGLVWVCASLAMLTKVALAATFGVSLRRWVPANFLRPLTTVTCLLLALLAALRVDT